MPADPALVLESALGPRDDPLVALLGAAYRRLSPQPPGEEDPAGLLVAGDGSAPGQRRIFERAARVGTALPPRFIPHRLSNGAASELAIRFQHTGRVLTMPDGPASLFRSIAFAVGSLGSEIGPARWIVLCGEVDEFDLERVRGTALALELRRGGGDALARFRLCASPGSEPVAPGESRSLSRHLAGARHWTSPWLLRDPERPDCPGWILGERA